MEYQNTKRDLEMFERRNKRLLLPDSPKTLIELGKYQATEARLKEVKAEMLDTKNTVKKLIIQQNQFNDSQAELLYGIIRQSTTLETIQINRCRLRRDQLERLCEAISHNAGNSIKEVNINHVRINMRGAQAISKMLTDYQDLNNLHLVDTSLDCDTLLEICKGIAKSKSMEFLDLRRNIFDDQGLAGLIKAFQANMVIKHIYLEGMTIENAEAKRLAKFLDRKDCMLEELEINEADLNIECLDLIMESICKADHLKKLTLAKNTLDINICQHLSKLPHRLHNFQSLSLSHCNLSDEALQTLCSGFYGEVTVKYLDFSWNNIQAKGMKYILEMLENNKSLSKLYIQHNSLGEEGAKEMVQALKIHPEMKYLDISANQIGSAGFLHFMELFKDNSTLQNLHVRKNNIKGEEILNFPRTLRDNSNLFYLDMQDNQLDVECADNLIELLHDNYFIEDLVIDGNNHIHQTQRDYIQHECRKNLMIKEYILPTLKSKEGNLLQDEHRPETSDVHFKNYNVKSLKIQNRDFFTSDFICKFIEMNKNDFHTLSLKKVSFQNKMKGLVEFLKRFKTKIQTIVIEDCDMGGNLASFIEDCKVIDTLQELHLRNMGLNIATKSVMLHLYNHKKLKILDLRDNQITSMTEIASLFTNNQVLEEVNITGNIITTAENFTVLLLGMANNMSITKLFYDVSQSIMPSAGNKLGIDSRELSLLEDQLRINEFIKAHIIPTQTRYRVRNTKTIDFSKQIDIGANINAAMKYFNCTADCTKLILSECHIDDDALMEITSILLQMNNMKLEELDLSDNLIQDVGCRHMAAILVSTKIKRINLSKNHMIDVEGFAEICKSIRSNKYIQSIDMHECGIDLSNATGWENILADIQQNCSLLKINLDGNSIHQDLITIITEEFKQNKSINDIIIPIIKNREKDKIKKKKQKEKKKGTQVTRKKTRADDFLGGQSPSLERQLEKKDAKLKELDIDLLTQSHSKDRSWSFSLQPFRRKSTLKEKDGIIDLEVGAQRFTEKYIDEVSSSSSSRTERVIQDDEGQRKSSNNLSKILETEEDSSKDGFKQDDVKKLVLRGKNLTDLNFLSKFIRENPQIEHIDLGDNHLLTDEQIQKFSTYVMRSQNLKTIGLGGIKNLKSSTRTIIQRELMKNEHIQEFIQGNSGFQDGTQKTLDLRKMQLQSVGFISKFLVGYQYLKVLDLTDNRLGNRGAKELTTLIEQTMTLETLTVRNNRISSQGLQHICSAMVANTTIKVLDIRDNMIPDESYKTLLAMLYRNQTVRDIRYTLQNEQNLESMKKFKELSQQPVEFLEAEFGRDHETLTCRQKACLPFWCWKSFIYDKHEAFRFKYDTKALLMVEEELMDGVRWLLYLNSFIYYTIMFVCPVIFLSQCGKGIESTAHYIYAGYSLLTFIGEIAIVRRIETKINNPKVLKFNKWHAVEILFGQIARFDTYLNVCVFHLLATCDHWNLAAPVGSLIVLNAIYPFFKMTRLYKIQSSFKHTLPKIEQNCEHAFIRENCCLATVLDSFCIDNNIEICNKPVTFGRWQGYWTIVTQDGPQYIIHLLQFFVVATQVPHTLSTVLMSLVISTFSIPMSIFNIIMGTQNEFDPIVLEIEMKKRRDKASIHETVLQKKKDILKNKLQKSGAKTGSAQQLALIGGNKLKQQRMSEFYDRENFEKEKKAIEDRSLQLNLLNQNISSQKSIEKPKQAKIGVIQKEAIKVQKKDPESPKASHDDIEFDDLADMTCGEETARRETLKNYKIERKSARMVRAVSRENSVIAYTSQSNMQH